METTTTLESTTSRTTMLWTAGISVLWLLIAIARPDTTLHLGPIVVPVIPAILSRGTNHAIRSTVAGILMAGAVLAVLGTSGNLNGPALGPFPNASSESLIFFAIGSIGGLAYARFVN